MEFLSNIITSLDSQFRIELIWSGDSVYIYTHDVFENQLSLAIHNNDIDKFNILLKSGLVKEDIGFEALIQAVELKRTGMLELLLQGGKIDLNQSSGDQATPLFIAVQNHYLEGVDLLSRYKANANIPNPKGIYPLELAFHNKDIDIITTLLWSSNANINQFYKDEMSPLFLAVHYNMPLCSRNPHDEKREST
jgi:ankyrin repeat protein